MCRILLRSRVFNLGGAWVCLLPCFNRPSLAHARMILFIYLFNYFLILLFNIGFLIILLFNIELIINQFLYFLPYYKKKIIGLEFLI